MFDKILKLKAVLDPALTAVAAARARGSCWRAT